MKGFSEVQNSSEEVDLLKLESQKSESCSIMSDSAIHGLYSPWNFPDQNTVVGRQTFPSPGYLPNPGIKPRTPALQADSLPSELCGKLRVTEEETRLKN